MDPRLRGDDGVYMLELVHGWWIPACAGMTMSETGLRASLVIWICLPMLGTRARD